MATLDVAAGQAYATLSAAVAASCNGIAIAVQAGTFVNNFAAISKDIATVATTSDLTALSVSSKALLAGKSTVAQSAGTATVATVSVADSSSIDLQNAVAADG